MRSRRYFSIVGSSVLLLLVSCLSQSTKEDKQGSSPAVQPTAPSVRDLEPLEAKFPQLPEPFPPETGVETADGSTEIEDPGPAAGDGGHAVSGAPKISKRPKGSKRRPDGCLKGQMRFEDKCLKKSIVEVLLERRAEEAKRQIQETDDPKAQTDAANKLIEQQIRQMEESENDLQEMIEKLKEEKEDKKHEDGP